MSHNNSQDADITLNPANPQDKVITGRDALKDAPLLDVRNLITYFFTEEGIVRAVEDVSFDIKKDEVVGLVGETGCGKSVTALSIIQLVRAPGKIVGGDVVLKGEHILPPHLDVVKHRVHALLMQSRKKIAMAQEGSLMGSITASGTSPLVEGKNAIAAAKKANKENLKRIREIRGKNITMIFQDPMNSLNPVLSVEYQLSEVFLLHQRDELLAMQRKSYQAWLDEHQERRVAHDERDRHEKASLKILANKSLLAGLKQKNPAEYERQKDIKEREMEDLVQADKDAAIKARTEIEQLKRDRNLQEKESRINDRKQKGPALFSALTLLMWLGILAATGTGAVSMVTFFDALKNPARFFELLTINVPATLVGVGFVIAGLVSRYLLKRQDSRLEFIITAIPPGFFVMIIGILAMANGGIFVMIDASMLGPSVLFSPTFMTVKLPLLVTGNVLFITALLIEMLVHGSPKRRVLSIILSIVAAGAYLNPFNLEKLVLFLVDRSPLIPIIFLITFPALLIVGTILVRNEGLELFGGLFTCISSFMILVVNIYFITFFSMIVLIVGLIGGFLGILAHKDITNPMKLDLRHFAYLKVREALEKVKIPDPDKVMHSFPHELSGGMRQRVMIAMALACNPDLLIADEPTTALDVTIQAQILSLMRDLKARFKTSILLITHDLGVVAEMCDRVAVMYSGRIIEYAPVKSLFKQPLHPYTQGLMASIPKVEEKKEKLLIIPGSVPNLIRPPAGCRFHPRCPRRMPMCDKALPQLVEAQPGHKVACYLYVDGNKEV